MKIFKLEEHLKDASSAGEVAGIYWSSRDMSSSPVGNHHFITFVYESEEQAARIAALGFPVTFSEENDKGIRIYFATMGVGKDNGTKGIVIETSPKYDRVSIKEISKEDNTHWYSSDYDFQGHRIPPELASPAFGSHEDLMAAITERYKNFNAHFNAGDVVPYSLVDENCACITNSLLKVLGYSASLRRELGEFQGVDWGEEDLVDEHYFEKMPYVEPKKFPYIGNLDTKELHLPECEWAKKIWAGNRKGFNSIEEALAQGYNGCHFCLDKYDTD